MTALPKTKIYSPEEYLALEDICKYKSEYVGGYIHQTAGGSESHIQISFNAAKILSEKLRGKYRALISAMKVWVEDE